MKSQTESQHVFQLFLSHGSCLDTAGIVTLENFFMFVLFLSHSFLLTKFVYVEILRIQALNLSNTAICKKQIFQSLIQELEIRGFSSDKSKLIFVSAR